MTAVRRSCCAPLLMACLVACGDGEQLDRTALCELEDGRLFKPGDNFPFGDECNHCYCPDDSYPNRPGLWGCTAIACEPTGMFPDCAPVRGTTCTLGPACGSGCCGQGERCVGGTCVCGEHPACETGDICGTSAPLVDAEGCGTVCCPPGGPCP